MLALSCNSLLVLNCDSQDLTLQSMLSDGVATVRQTLSRILSAMAERAKKGRKLVQTLIASPDATISLQCQSAQRAG